MTENPQNSHLSEQLPQLLVLVHPQHVVAGEDGGAGHAEDVVDVDDEVGDVTERGEAEDNLLPRCRRSDNKNIEYHPHPGQSDGRRVRDI